jgi:prepilin-type N-terminal cleavage/methylation domain-containing protein
MFHRTIRLRRRGYTLVEMSIATLVAAVVVTAVMSLLVSGSRLFSSGQNAVRGPEAAVLIIDRLERDLVQVLQVPGDPRPPVAIEDDGTTMAFYVPGENGVLSTPKTVVGVPVWWGLVEDEDEPGIYHPVRDGEVIEGVALLGWEISLWSPKDDPELPGWYVTVRLRFRADSLAGEPYVYARAIHLLQPSTNYTSFPTFGDDLNPGLVRLLPPPEHPAFEAIRPPRPGELTKPKKGPRAYYDGSFGELDGAPVEELP